MIHLKVIHYNIFPKFCKFVLRINECGHFSDNHVLELDIFKSLNNFEGGGVILMACILVFHMTR
jgi:hypothetical protein